MKTEAEKYRMKVHVFGAASSPGCVNYDFQKAADDGKKEFGTSAADFVGRDFYVDNGFKSVNNASTAVNLIQKTQDICARAGLRLYKFGNNRKLLRLSLQKTTQRDYKAST